MRAQCFSYCHWLLTHSSATSYNHVLLIALFPKTFQNTGHHRMNDDFTSLIGTADARLRRVRDRTTKAEILSMVQGGVLQRNNGFADT